MSIIYLTSDGQNPHNFTNQFSQGIHLGRGAEVSVMGYNGNTRLRAVQAGEAPTEMTIVEGANDAFTVYHGKIADGTSLKEVYYAPFLVKLTAGNYTPEDLATEIAGALNYYEYIDQFRNGWTCVWGTVAPNINKFTITCGKLRQGAPVGGNWVEYAGKPGGVTPAAGSDTLIPFTPAAGVNPEIKRSCFLDLKTGFIGDTTQAIGSTAVGSQGYGLSFTTTDTDYSKIQVSMGIVPENRATRCDRNRSLDDAGADLTGSSRTADLIWNGSKPINGNLDFALDTPTSTEWVGFFGLGMTIGLDGNVGIIETEVGIDTNTPKDPVNRKITWTATNIGAAGLKKLLMCPRYSTVLNLPVMEFLADVGAGYVSIATVNIGTLNSGAEYYRDSVKMHYGVVFDSDYINAAMINAWTAISLHTGGGGAAPAEPLEPITLGWRPLGYNDSLNTPIHQQSGLTKLQEGANMSDFTGWKTTEDTNLTTGSSVGFTSTEAVTTTFELESVNQPLIITSPDLTAKGYMGGGAGGMGAEAQILGVVRTNGRLNDYGFSSSEPDNWIHLNNTAPIMMNSLTIILKDEMNREANTLEPNFNVWLKFRSDKTTTCPPKHNLVVGGF